MKEKEPLSFRMEPSLHQRLEECAKRLKLKKYALGLLAIEAAVEAIERNGYRLVLPIEFNVAQIPMQAQAAAPEAGRSPNHRGQVALAEDSDKPKPNSEKDTGRKLASDLAKKIVDDVHSKGQPPK